MPELKSCQDKLRRSHEELEKFAYVASHDIKAPLRNIENLARWVIEDTVGILPEDACRKLEMICGRTQMLGTLLDDILAYSRAGRIVGEAARIDVREFLESLLPIYVPPSFKCRIAGNMPVVVSPRTPLEQIFGNLLANAVRHHDRKESNIEITVRESGGFFEFAVKDDGPGIPPEFHERVFQMFQTLKPRNDSGGGSGLGLAIVKKLVEWQDGQVWIVSDAGQRGTAVYFLWPREARAPDSI